MFIRNKKNRLTDKITKHNHDKWHVWFAWYPVESDEGMIWLEKIWRKRQVKYVSHLFNSSYEIVDHFSLTKPKAFSLDDEDVELV